MLKTLAQLFLSFAKIGAFTFGGGYAMIPLIQKEAVERRGWVTQEDMLDVVVLAESTPGPIAINSATFIGQKTAGVAGAACATLGVVLPSFAIILALSSLLQAFSQVRAVRYAFFGIRAGVLALILRALWSLYRQCPKSGFSWAVMGLALAAAALLRVDAALIIALCAVAGIVYSQIRRGKA